MSKKELKADLKIKHGEISPFPLKALRGEKTEEGISWGLESLGV